MWFKFLKILVVIFLLSATVAVAQSVSLQLSPLTQIGLEDSDDMNYIFSHIRAVAVNSKGDVYITNTSDHTIRVFDKNGTFIRILGGKGRGPGEYLDLTSISIDSDDRVVAVDRFQDKVIRYEVNSTDFESILLPETSFASLRLARTYPDDKRLLLIYRHTEGASREANLVHIMDKDSESILDRHADVFELFYDKSIPIEAALSSSPMYQTTNFSTNKVAVTPYIFTGSIVIFNIESKKTELIGNPISPFYDEYNPNRREYYESIGITGFASISNQTGRYMFKNKGSTLGLVGNSRYLLHFYIMEDENMFIPHVNIYSHEGNLIKSQSLVDSNIVFHDGRYFSSYPKFLDENNNLYVYDTNLFPKVQVYNTNLDEF